MKGSMNMGSLNLVQSAKEAKKQIATRYTKKMLSLVSRRRFVRHYQNAMHES